MSLDQLKETEGALKKKVAQNIEKRIIPQKPLITIVVGMAGSGKTTLMQRLNSHLHSKQQPYYVINLDPAVINLPYEPNVDIRDTVNYKEVMKQYNLGPNGGILTSNNLFATKFDQVIKLLEKPREVPLEYVLVDTPGQIEIFTWSASGNVVMELFKSSFRTVIAFVVDTPRCVNPQTFMSNMLQACSILYRTKLPLVLVFTKTDINDCEFAMEWMRDYESFQTAIDKDTSYASTLHRSLALVLDEFYKNLKAVGVSSLTGQGIDELLEALETEVAQ